MTATDFKLDDFGDLEINKGDFPVNDSDQIHIEHILKSNKGYWFENPLLGVGIVNEIKSSTTRQRLKQDIRRNLVLDNYSVKEISISNDFEININALRKL